MENNKYHILIVDDDDRIRGLLKDYLTENNYIVSTAENAEEARHQLQAQHQGDGRGEAAGRLDQGPD